MCTEDRPGRAVIVQVADEHGAPGRVTIDARPTADAQLHQFDEPAALVGRRHHLQPTLIVDQKYAARGGLDQRGTGVNHRMEKINDVVSVDQSVSERHQRVNERPFTRTGIHD
jgi:hypothetical protein